MSTDFFVHTADGDPTQGQQSFADALRARFGQHAVQNVSGHEIFRPPPPKAEQALPSATSLRFPPALTLPPRLPPTQPLAMAATSSLTAPPPGLSLPSLRLPPAPGGSATCTGSSSSSAAPPSDASFAPTTHAELPALLADPHALVIDIRPHAQYAGARLPRAVSLAVPSTLLRRPAFGLSKLAEMLSPCARRKLERWRAAPRVLVYDADAGAATAPGPAVAALLRKFAAAGADPARLTWLAGGFQRIWREHRELVDADPASDEDDEEDDSPSTVENGPEPLRARHLPLAAFTTTSTTGAKIASASSVPLTATSARELTQKPHRLEGPRSAAHVAFNPFYDAIRQNTELVGGITERIPLRLAPAVLARAHELPFGWLRDLAARAGEAPPEGAPPPAAPAPHADEGAEALAMQFYRIELAEQRRLTGVMSHHAHEARASAAPTDTAPRADAPAFPFSITAGVEKGAKNRYRNIWPFEHSRVRLGAGAGGDDYVNASFIQPLCTSRRYIATQGPLPATFDDFWA
jgi:rhodanese-related sulfurtransferase